MEHLSVASFTAALFCAVIAACYTLVFFPYAKPTRVLFYWAVAICQIGVALAYLPERTCSFTASCPSPISFFATLFVLVGLTLIVTSALAEKIIKRAKEAIAVYFIFEYLLWVVLYVSTAARLEDSVEAGNFIPLAIIATFLLALKNVLLFRSIVVAEKRHGLRPATRRK